MSSYWYFRYTVECDGDNGKEHHDAVIQSRTKMFPIVGAVQNITSQSIDHAHIWIDTAIQISEYDFKNVLNKLSNDKVWFAHV